MSELRMSPLLRTLAALSVVELLSVLTLLANLATVHNETLASILGPAHGALYLAVAAVALLGRGLTTWTRIGAVIPVVSGPLTMVNVRREAQRA
jgi:hypothetical protein